MVAAENERERSKDPEIVTLISKRLTGTSLWSLIVYPLSRCCLMQRGARRD